MPLFYACNSIDENCSFPFSAGECIDIKSYSSLWDYGNVHLGKLKIYEQYLKLLVILCSTIPQRLIVE